MANQDLWAPLIDHVLERGDVTWTWVKGHSGDEWNDVVDRLAVEAATTQVGRSGDRPPDFLGPADAVGNAPAAPDASAASPTPAPASPSNRPEGHTVAVLGHRPPELGGYEPNFLQAAVQRRLGDVLAAQAELDEDLVLLTGLQLGAEQLAAEAALDHGIPWSWCSPSRTPTASGRPPPGRRIGDSWPGRGRWCSCRRSPCAHRATSVGPWPSGMPGSLARPMPPSWCGTAATPLLGKAVKALEQQVGDEVWIIDPGELA